MSKHKRNNSVNSERHRKSQYPMKVWFTSDLHFGHRNIIEYCSRPFKTVKEMDDALIHNWNSKVGKHDTVIVIGDFCYGKPNKYLNKLNGHITFIRGNHDDRDSLDARIMYLVVNAEGREMFCTHEPEDFNNAYALNLVGHIHKMWTVKKIYNSFLVNVGADVWNYEPTDINAIAVRLQQFATSNKSNTNGNGFDKAHESQPLNRGKIQ